MNTEDGFAEIVSKHFDFLKKEYGFLDHPSELGFINGPVELEFHHGKGEVDIFFFIRRDDNIFRPFISRSFDIWSIIKRQMPDTLHWPNDIPEYLTTMEDIDKYLSFCSEFAKKYCKTQFEVDMALFEEIHLERRKTA